jgi:hypothetical protein
MEEQPFGAEPPQSPSKFSAGFLVTIAVVVPLVLALANIEFLFNLRTSTYGEETTAKVLKKDQYSTGYRTSRGTVGYMGNYDVEVSFAPNRSAIKIDLPRDDWEKIEVGQPLRIKMYAGSAVAMDYSYSGTRQFKFTVGIVIGILLVAGFLMKNSNA